MGTSYYKLVDPVSSVRLEEGPGHDRLTIWENGANAGTLVVSKGEGRRFTLLFVDRETTPPIRTHWGGEELGSVVTENEDDLQDSTMIVSEYGEIITVAEVRARHGARRADGWPTELFGYEKGS